MALMISDIEGVKIVTFGTLAILDPVEVDAIGQQLYKLVDERAHRKIVLDFRKVRQLSSQMLGTLIKLNKKSKAIKGKVVLCGLRPDLLKAFTVTRLDKILQIADDEQQARGLFSALGGDQGLDVW